MIDKTLIMDTANCWLWLILSPFLIVVGLHLFQCLLGWRMSKKIKKNPYIVYGERYPF